MRFLLFGALLVAIPACTAKRQAKFFDSAEERVQRGGYNEAADDLRRGIAINPESALAVKALYRLGFLQEVYLRDHESAIQSFKEYRRLVKDPVALYEVEKRIANIYFEHTQDAALSIVAYSKLIELEPNSLERDLFLYRIIRSHFLLSNFEKARSEAERFLELFPKSQLVPKVRFEIGNAYFMEGKYALAVEALKQVLRHHPQHPQSIEAQFWIAQGYDQLGDYSSARALYEQLLVKYPSPEIIEKRIKALGTRERGHG